MSVIRESFWVSEFWVYFSEISLILVSQSHVEDSVDIFSALAKLTLLCSPPSMPRDSPQLSSVAQSCPTLCNPMDYNPPGSSVHEDSPGKNTGVSCHASARRSSQPREGGLFRENLWGKRETPEGGGPRTTCGVWKSSPSWISSQQEPCLCPLFLNFCFSKLRSYKCCVHWMY